MVCLSSSLLPCIALVVFVSGAVIPHRRAESYGRWRRTAPRAIYFISNDASNNIVALSVQGDGTLAAGTLTPTGGAGGNEVDGMTKQPATPDALGSQGAIRVAGNV